VSFLNKCRFYTVSVHHLCMHPSIYSLLVTQVIFTVKLSLKHFSFLLYLLVEMNVESSRSHLIIGIMIESRNLTNGSVSFGKLSLVDLAGSERAAKTGAKDDQLKVFF